MSLYLDLGGSSKVKLERIGQKYVSKVSNMESLISGLENEIEVLNKRTSLKKKPVEITKGKRKGQTIDELHRLWGNIKGRNEIKVFLKCKNRKVYLTKEMGENKEDIIIDGGIDNLKKYIKIILKKLEGKSMGESNLYWYIGKKEDRKLVKIPD